MVFAADIMGSWACSHCQTMTPNSEMNCRMCKAPRVEQVYPTISEVLDRALADSTEVIEDPRIAELERENAELRKRRDEMWWLVYALEDTAWYFTQEGINPDKWIEIGKEMHSQIYDARERLWPTDYEAVMSGAKNHEPKTDAEVWKQRYLTLKNSLEARALLKKGKENEVR